MYRQVWIHPEHRPYQRILWRNNSRDDISIYELNTVTYGMTSAPFLAIRCLSQLSNENMTELPQECKIIAHDFYVDDMMTGSNSLEQLKLYKSNIQTILSSGGFTLRKFNSNVPELRDDSFNIAYPHLNLMNTESKTLGIYWNPNSDILQYSSEINTKYTDVTKRSVLAETAQLFDPLGLWSSIIIIPKLIIQELWQLNLSWDESIPMDLYIKWKKFKDNLRYINRISIPRMIIVKGNTFEIEIHAFSDASERAYGSCVYIRSRSNNNTINVQLLAAKSRVAPLKAISIPRLELCAAVLSAQLVSKFKTILENTVTISNECYWSDSTITLSWLKLCPSKLKTYVANRVAEIQRLTNQNNWSHVSTHDNPADLITRGMYPEQLITTPLWWHGSEWLSNDVNSFSNDLSKINVELLPDLKQCTQTFITTTEDDSFIKKYSTLTKLIRVTAYCLRFKNNCLKSKNDPQYGTLTMAELSNSLTRILLLVKKLEYPQEYEALKTGKQISTKSNLLSLTPFLDADGLIRVGGRLTLSNYNYDKRHPIMLPKGSHLTQLIFRHEHLKLLHAGPKLLLTSIREKYWPISGINHAKQIVRKCNHCFKFNLKTASQLMGNLPIERIQFMYPFHSTGVDYAGPYLIKSMSGRGSKLSKSYICIFICFAVKAIHIELVSDLTTNKFLLAFKRFIARRGNPLHMYSANATNFIGAKNEVQNLDEFMKENISHVENYLSNEGINWHFIPPRSPTFGGLWEAGVKRVKYHLNRILGNQPLTFEELTTVLTHVESLLNSRPLSPLTSDPNDLDTLTPAHFLIGRSFCNLPDPNVLDIPENRLSRFQLLQNLNQQFWRKWSRDYLCELQQRTKWQKSTTSINEGTMVLLKDENTPPAHWRVGRVTHLHPGTDGLTRVVTVNCKGGELKRAIGKLCVLPSQ